MKKMLKGLLAVSMSASAFGLTYATQPSQVEQAQAATTRYAQVDHLNIRTGPSTKYRVVGQFHTNDKVSVLKSYNAKWYQISYKGAKRYVSKAYVGKLPKAIAMGQVNTGGSNLNIRSGPGTSYKIVGKYKDGAYIQLTSYSNAKWFQVVYKGKIAYVSTTYVDGPFDAR